MDTEAENQEKGIEHQVRYPEPVPTWKEVGSHRSDMLRNPETAAAPLLLLKNSTASSLQWIPATDVGQIV